MSELEFTFSPNTKLQYVAIWTPWENMTKLGLVVDVVIGIWIRTDESIVDLTTVVRDNLEGALFFLTTRILFFEPVL